MVSFVGLRPWTLAMRSWTLVMQHQNSYGVLFCMQSYLFIVILCVFWALKTMLS